MTPRDWIPAARRLTSCLALAAALAFAGVAHAGPPGEWTRITDPEWSSGQIGLARTPDGVLHVAWRRKDEAKDTIELLHTALRPNGRIAGSPVVITSGWPSMAEPDLVAVHGGLRVFFGGIPASETPVTGDGSLYTASAGPEGARWTLQPYPASDASFVYLETPNTPMHIGSVGIYDPATAPGGFVRFKDILNFVESRLANPKNCKSICSP